jgi:uncharacterized protein YfdQ (DUF2303 family)
MDTETIQTIVAAVCANLAKPVIIDSGTAPFVMVPKGYCLLGVTNFRDKPRVIEADPSFVDAGSFSDYVNRFKTPNTQLFATVSVEGLEVQAIFDYHAPNHTPERCSFRAKFLAKYTPEWNTWTIKDRSGFSQLEFATWLEENAKLIVSPTGADLLELVKSLEAKQSVNYNSAIRLDNGSTRLNFEERIEATSNTASGKMDMPATIKAGIAVFEGSDPYEINARLKYRLNGSKLSIWYETVQKHDILRVNIKELVKKIATATTIVPYLGNA